MLQQSMYALIKAALKWIQSFAKNDLNNRDLLSSNSSSQMDRTKMTKKMSGILHFLQYDEQYTRTIQVKRF